MTSWLPQGDRARPPVGVLAEERPHEQRRGERLPGDVGDRRAHQPEAHRVHQQGAEDEAQQAARQHVADRAAQLLDAAQPAVAGQRDQQQGRAEPGDAQPLLTGGGDVARRPGQQAGERPGEELEQQPGRPGPRPGQPGGLHALGDGAGPVAGPGAAGGAGRRAVGEEVQQGRRPGEQSPADGQPAERHGAQMPDDGGVDQQVQRLGRQHDERRNGEGEHRRAAVMSRDHGAGPRRAVDVVRAP